LILAVGIAIFTGSALTYLLLKRNEKRVISESSESETESSEEETITE
jgi:hypothetical protein